MTDKKINKTSFLELTGRTSYVNDSTTSEGWKLKTDPEYLVASLDEVLGSAKALGLLKNPKGMSYRDQKWFLDKFLTTVAKAIFAQSRRKATNKPAAVGTLNQMPFEDIMGVLAEYVFSHAGQKLVSKYSPCKGTFIQLLYRSSVHHIRDKAHHYDFGGKSVPRTRNDDPEDLKLAKKNARFGNAEVVDKDSGKSGDQSAIEAETINFKELNARGIFSSKIDEDGHKEFLNQFINDFPLIFSNIILGLKSDEVFLSPIRRKSLMNKEIYNLFYESSLSENLTEHEKEAGFEEVRRLLRVWRSNKGCNTQCGDVNWCLPLEDYHVKINLLESLGVEKNNAELYLEWLWKQYVDQVGMDTALQHQVFR